MVGGSTDGAISKRGICVVDIAVVVVDGNVVVVDEVVVVEVEVVVCGGV